MKNNLKYLVWLDLEMTGLNPEIDEIIEMAIVITDLDLNIIDKTESIAIFQNEETLLKMDNWNIKTHTSSGLIDRVRKSKISVKSAEKLALDFLKKHMNEKEAPLCGNSIHQDKRFLYKYMNDFAHFMHYRQLDVSSLKILTQAWKPEILEDFNKESSHLALNDILESIEELKFYRKSILKI